MELPELVDVGVESLSLSQRMVMPQGDAPRTHRGWSWSAPAVAALAALAEALREVPEPRASSVDELLYRTSEAGSRYEVTRAVRSSEGELLLLPSVAALAPLMKRSDDRDKPAVLLLSNTFDTERGVLRLTTLFVPPGGQLGGEGAGERQLWTTSLPIVFGRDALFEAGPQEESAVSGLSFTDLALGERQGMSSTDTAALPRQLRTAVRSSLRAQLFAATAACVRQEWLGGFLCLRPAAERARPELAECFHALTAHLSSSASSPGEELTRAAVDARMNEAVALEMRARFAEAAAIYQQCARDDLAHPELHLVGTPALVWSYLGLALKRSGKLEQAAASYSIGLSKVSGHAEPDTPEWRDSCRILLHDLQTMLFELEPQKRDAAAQAMFAAQVAELRAVDDEVAFHYCEDGVQAMGVRTLRRWENAQRPGKGLNKGLTLFYIRELPAAPPRALAALQLTERRRAQAAKAAPPRLCAACGAPGALNTCSACGGPHYCGAACQKQHWRKHNPACKATQAQREGTR